MFKKILIANRGEIACRIIRTSKKLGIKTAVIYHPVDAQSLYVKEADEAVCIESISPRAAYLDGEKIIAAARSVGAQAIHPGYGFLAENKLFAEVCGQAGIVFIGPRPRALEVMGQKDKAKQLMQEVGVPTIPGYLGDSQSIEVLSKAAEQIGFPLLIKAVSGGGGKAMRLVSSSEELSSVLPNVQREAQQSFVDARIMLEKYLPNARHIEVQIFGDQFKNYLHLFERDCSLQRRYQKIVEEAPAPNLTEEMQHNLWRSALLAAKSIEYLGAGTVEFLVADQDYYFLEMNTRLQVEHPVTEFITGTDLVEWQIRVASGEALPVKQADLHAKGHAIEVRICAEDPQHDFLPAIGEVKLLHYPTENAHVRIENGIQQNDKITPYFDSLLAKLIVRAETRESALKKLQIALAETKIEGVITNLDFLRKLIEQLQHFTQPLSTQSLPEIISLFKQTEISPWEQSIGWRLNASSVGMKERINQHHITDNHNAAGLQAPMPGIVVQIYVKEGKSVAAGDRLLAIEAMKMEHTIRAPYAGIVQKLHYKLGDLVNVGDVLVEVV